MVLGGTIEELQSRMKLSELTTWIAYRKKHGAMNDVRRYDRPAALISYVASRLMGGKSQMKDFMPFGREEKEASFTDIVKALGGGKVGKPR